MDVTVSNFGPIGRASVRLRPLTVLVGPNNSGKSYFVTLVYSAFRAAARQSWAIFGGHDFHALGVTDEDILRSAETRLAKRAFQAPAASPQELDAESRQLSSALLAASHGRDGLHVDLLPPILGRYVRDCAKDAVRDYADDLARELRRCFAAELGELAARYDRDDGIHVGLRDKLLDIDIAFSSSHDVTLGQQHDISRLHIVEDDFAGLLRLVQTARSPSEASDAWMRFQRMLGLLVARECFHGMLKGAYYLPAARSGILQSYKLVASFLIQQLSGLAPQTFSSPRLTGVVTDFMSLLVSMPTKSQRDLAPIAEVLERDVIEGSVSVEPSVAQFPDLQYVSDLGSLPLHRTSSMISEIAPIVLFLRHIVRPGDVLIIEEPEAHLHPANQRKLADAIARMIRSGAQVLLTTHSDYFLAQLSNCVRRSALDDSSDDYLRPEEVGVYLFSRTGPTRSSVAEELSVSANDGISEKGFIEVAEELYDETVQLQESASR